MHKSFFKYKIHSIFEFQDNNRIFFYRYQYMDSLHDKLSSDVLKGHGQEKITSIFDPYYNGI